MLGDGPSKKSSPKLKLVEKKIHIADESEILQRLGVELDHSSDVYRKAGARAGTIASLAYLVSELHELGYRPAQLHPLWSLLSALHDLDKGITSSLFTPVRRRGRPPSSNEDLARWAAAAALITMLIEKDRSLETASREVSRILTKHGIPHPTRKGSDRPNWECLMDWRHDVLRGKRSKGGRVLYDNRLAIARDMDPDTAIMFLKNDMTLGSKQTV